MSSAGLKLALGLCFALPVSCSEVELGSQTGAWVVGDTNLGTTLRTEQPRLAMSADGRACLAWVEASDVEPNRLMAAHYDVGSGWSPAELVAEATTIAAVSVTMDGGQLIVVWQEEEGAKSTALHSRFTSDTGWEASRPLDPEAPDCDGCFRSASVALDKNGKGLAISTVRGDATTTVRAGPYDAGGLAVGDLDALLDHAFKSGTSRPRGCSAGLASLARSVRCRCPRDRPSDRLHSPHAPRG